MFRTPVRARDGQAGFTLIELVVVIGAVALVMAVLTLAVSRASDSFALRRAASVAMSELRRAQGAAVAGGEDYTAEFVLGSPGAMTIYRQTTVQRTVSGQEWPATVSIDGPGTTFPLCTTPGNPANKCVTFRSFGDAWPTGGVVRLLNRSGVAVNVQIVTATGRVSIAP